MVPAVKSSNGSLWVLDCRGAPVTAYASRQLDVALVDSREFRNRTAPACAATADSDGEGAETRVDGVLVRNARVGPRAENALRPCFTRPKGLFLILHSPPLP